MAFELGDAMRSWCNPHGEDAGSVTFDLPIFAAAIARISQRGRALVTRGRAASSIVVGLETVCIELAARFAVDVFEDRYFGWDPARFPSRRAHNLVRARGQLALGLARSRAARQDALGVVGLVTDLTTATPRRSEILPADVKRTASPDRGLRSNRRYGRSRFAGAAWTGCLVAIDAERARVRPQARHAHCRATTLTAMPAAEAASRCASERDDPTGPVDAAARVVAVPRSGRCDVAGGVGSPRPACRSRIWGAGIAAPGAIANAAIAEQRRAPGARRSPRAARARRGGQRLRARRRTVRRLRSARSASSSASGGMRVVGGQVSFRFKADRLFVIGSRGAAERHGRDADGAARAARAMQDRAIAGAARMSPARNAPVAPLGERGRRAARRRRRRARLPRRARR